MGKTKLPGVTVDDVSGKKSKNGKIGKNEKDKKKKKKKKKDTAIVLGATIKPAIGKELVQCAKDGRIDDNYFCSVCQCILKDNAAREAHVRGAKHISATGRVVYSSQFQYEQRERPKPPPESTNNTDTVQLPELKSVESDKKIKLEKNSGESGKKKTGKGDAKATGPATAREPEWAAKPLPTDFHSEFVKITTCGITSIIRNEKLCDPFGCVNGKNYEMWLGLGIIAAARFGHGRAVRTLYHYGGSRLKPDYPDPDENNTTALHAACALGYLSDCVEFLIEIGANVNAKKLNGFTPLHVAAEGTCESIVRNLQKHNANIDEPTRRGFTPLHIASWHGNLGIIKVLLQFKANPMARVDNGATPLHLASMRGKIDALKLLIKAGAEVNAMMPAPSLKGIPGDGYNEITPIQLAFAKDDAALVQQLLALGANEREAYHAKHTAEDLLQAAEEKRLEDLRLASA